MRPVGRGNRSTEPLRTRCGNVSCPTCPACLCLFVVKVIGSNDGAQDDPRSPEPSATLSQIRGVSADTLIPSRTSVGPNV